MTIESFKQQQRMLQAMLDDGPQMYALYLNDMRMSRIEQTALVAIFDTAELGQAFLDEQLLPDGETIIVKDGGKSWTHYYRPGLLWTFNTPFSDSGQGLIPCQPWVDYFKPDWMSGAAPPENPSGLEPFDILRGDITEELVKKLAEWQRDGKI